jgi:hypothetical protein
LSFLELFSIFCLAHWLAIEGKQPTINENPEIISKADLTADSLDPVRFGKKLIRSNLFGFIFR